MTLWNTSLFSCMSGAAPGTPSDMELSISGITLKLHHLHGPRTRFLRCHSALGPGISLRPRNENLPLSQASTLRSVLDYDFLPTHAGISFRYTAIPTQCSLSTPSTPKDTCGITLLMSSFRLSSTLGKAIYSVSDGDQLRWSVEIISTAPNEKRSYRYE